MERRKFLKFLGISIAAVAINPKEVGKILVAEDSILKATYPAWQSNITIAVPLSNEAIVSMYVYIKNYVSRSC